MSLSDPNNVNLIFWFPSVLKSAVLNQAKPQCMRGSFWTIGEATVFIKAYFYAQQKGR